LQRPRRDAARARRIAAVLALLGALAGLPALAPAEGLLAAPTPATVASADPVPPGPFNTPPTALRSPRDLGNRLCAAYALYCADIWREKMGYGIPFNLLISEVCLHVRVFETERAGIACLETAIRAVPTLPESVLVDQQFGFGERARHAVWHDRTDRQWAEAVLRYFARIPAYCRRATEDTADYFPCLLREVQFFQTVLKRHRMG
jgi:hypothetical protein